MNGPATRRAPGLAWSPADALRCGLCTIPAALVVVFGDPSKGLAWAVDVLPAAIIGLAPQASADRTGGLDGDERFAVPDGRDRPDHWT